MDDEEHFDIFTHHSRFHAANVRSVMPQDTKRVTILREPASLFESLYNYYHFQQMFKGSKLDLATLLANSTAENLIDIFDSGPRLAYRIGHNQVQNFKREFLKKKNDFFAKMKIYMWIKEYKSHYYNFKPTATSLTLFFLFI